MLGAVECFYLSEGCVNIRAASAEVLVGQRLQHSFYIPALLGAVRNSWLAQLLSYAGRW